MAHISTGNHLYDALRAASIGREAAIFLTDFETGKDISFGAFFDNAHRIAAALIAHGVQPGDRVAVQAPKSVAMLELYIGTILAGAVFLPLNPSYTPPEIEYFLTDATPRVFICAQDTADLSREACTNAGVGAILTIGDNDTGSLQTARDAASPITAPVKRETDDLAAILYTSGTTGRSKGAMLSHGALCSNAQVLRDAWRFTREDVLIHALPIFHTHGLFVATNITLMAGSRAIFMRGFDASAIISAMPQATTLMGVPTFYTRLLAMPELGAASKSMRLFISGSAPLLAETHIQWQQTTGHAILERYGMTETNMNTSNPYDGDRRAGTVGFPLPGVELKICDPKTGATLPQGEIGVLEVRGPNLFDGYWQMPEKTREELREDGFFITGDLGCIDDDGYIQIVGRGKDLIITGGFNVYPKEVETAIDALDGVLESAVIGAPHTDFGEGVVAVVVPQEGAKLTAKTVTDGLAGTLAKFKRPKSVIIVDALPRNTMGKVQKNVLRDTHRNALSKDTKGATDVTQTPTSQRHKTDRR
jgi:malonyl-CoA/methylmalonyl-CoA synthetase